MKSINAIVPRGLQALLILAILAVLVLFLAPENFFYPSIGIAAFLAIVAIFFIYRSSAAVYDSKDASDSKKKKRKKSDDEVQDAEPSIKASGETGDGSPDKENPSSEDAVLPESVKFRPGFKSLSDKPSGLDVAEKYYRMAAVAKAEEERNTWRPGPAIAETKAEEPPAAEVAAEETNSEEKATPDTADEGGTEPEAKKDIETEEETHDGETQMPLINEETTLTDEDKSELENAVWYRCENPYCKYTHFLDVHHIIDEKNGGANRLENLIVLCPYCHELAHKNEIPEKEMRSWISNREERFKFKVNWRYQ